MSSPGQQSENARPSEGDLRILGSISTEDVTWQSNMAGRRSYRLWSTEFDYVTCTPAAKRVIARGWAVEWTGYVHGRGGVELTPAGRTVLDDHSDGDAEPGAAP